MREIRGDLRGQASAAPIHGRLTGGAGLRATSRSWAAASAAQFASNWAWTNFVMRKLLRPVKDPRSCRTKVHAGEDSPGRWLASTRQKKAPGVLRL
jgi:hypothetical protein